MAAWKQYHCVRSDVQYLAKALFETGTDWNVHTVAEQAGERSAEEGRGVHRRHAVGRHRAGTGSGAGWTAARSPRPPRAAHAGVGMRQQVEAFGVGGHQRRTRCRCGPSSRSGRPRTVRSAGSPALPPRHLRRAGAAPAAACPRARAGEHRLDAAPRRPCRRRSSGSSRARSRARRRSCRRRGSGCRRA